MLDPDVRRVLEGTSIAHLATVLPDGSPHVVPLWIGAHGERIVFLTGPGSRNPAWEIIDRLSTKYTGAPYPRGQERVVVVIEPERQTVGVG